MVPHFCLTILVGAPVIPGCQVLLAVGIFLNVPLRLIIKTQGGHFPDMKFPDLSSSLDR